MFQFVWVDATDLAQQGSSAAFFLERPVTPPSPASTVNRGARQGEFWVPQTPLLGESTNWAYTASGDHVRVPMVPYITKGTGAAWLWGLGLEIGMRAMLSVMGQLHGRTIEKIILILSHECQEVPNGYRCFAGIAIQVT